MGTYTAAGIIDNNGIFILTEQSADQRVTWKYCMDSVTDSLVAGILIKLGKESGAVIAVYVTDTVLNLLGSVGCGIYSQIAAL